VSYPEWAGLRRRTALTDVAFEANAGDTVAILGANGSGKSTLLRILAGIDSPQRGIATIAGFAAGTRGACARLGYCPEESPFPPGLSVYNCLHDCGTLSGLRGAALRTRIDALLQLWDLSKVASSRTGRLSRGQTRRLTIAQALLHEPDLLLFDEPTSGLDALGVLTFEETVHRLASERKCVLVTSHSASDVENLSNRILLLKDGRKALDAPTAQALQDDGVRELQISGLDAANLETIKNGVRAAGGMVLSDRPRRRSLADLFRSILKN
jgi:ABC-2 type transport system ATP-binding protein